MRDVIGTLAGTLGAEGVDRKTGGGVSKWMSLSDARAEGTVQNMFALLKALATLPPERTQPQKLCTANFSSGTLKTLINRLLRLKNKIF